jgi:rod shape determining protein RodA
LILPLFFAAISLTMIASITYGGGFPSREMAVQIAAYVIGFLVLGLMLLFDYKSFEKLEKFLYAGSILLLLTVYTGIGVTHYSSRAWINLGVTEMQPSELVKISFVLMFAGYLTRRQESLLNFRGVLLSALYASPFLLLIIKEDLGNGVVMCCICVGMVFYADIDGKLFARIAAVFFISVPVVYRFMAPHQKQRIDAFLHPDNFSISTNYHVWQSKVAIGSGGLFGKGLFSGTQKELNYLPVQQSDFIFAVIAEELGFVGGAAVIFLYAVFLTRVWRITSRAKDLYGALIAVGFLSMFGFQIFENIAMTMGLMPVTGITLPFISAGGSSILANMIALGLILNVGIRSKVINF